MLRNYEEPLSQSQPLRSQTLSVKLLKPRAANMLQYRDDVTDGREQDTNGM